MNDNTVLRALRLLRDGGLLEFRRGHGITVAGIPQRGAVLTQARELVRLARQHGYRRDELIQIIESLPCAAARSPAAERGTAVPLGP